MSSSDTLFARVPRRAEDSSRVPHHADDRNRVPLHADDISQFCKNLRAQLAHIEGTPSHLTLLNLLARSAGHRNFQAMRAAAISAAAPLEDVPVPIALPRGSTLPRSVQRALTHFDTAGRLLRWPTQRAVQKLVMWALWQRLPASRDLSEAEVNRYLAAFNAFDDPVTLRRELVNDKLLWRTQDGRTYRRLSQPVEGEVFEFLNALKAEVRKLADPDAQPKVQRKIDRRNRAGG